MRYYIRFFDGRRTSRYPNKLTNRITYCSSEVESNDLTEIAECQDREINPNEPSLSVAQRLCL